MKKKFWKEKHKIFHQQIFFFYSVKLGIVDFRSEVALLIQIWQECMFLFTYDVAVTIGDISHFRLGIAMLITVKSRLKATLDQQPHWNRGRDSSKLKLHACSTGTNAAA